MKNVKLRLDYFLSLGLMCVKGDNLGHIANCDFKIDSYAVCAFNDRSAPVNKDYFITSFASRENTGSQPVGDDVPVIAYYAACGNLAHSRGIAGAMLKLSKITSWKPDLDALIKMQIEHDAKLANKKAHEIITNQHEINTAMSESKIKNTQEKFDNGTVSDVSINTPNQGDKRRIEYCSNNSGQLEVEPVTFMFETDKEICCIDSTGLILVVDKEEFVAWHPVVSELETAKKKQITDVLNAVNHSGYLVSRESIRLIQDAGMLREIILPLDK